jgi:hypothetical protein
MEGRGFGMRNVGVPSGAARAALVRMAAVLQRTQATAGKNPGFAWGFERRVGGID